MPQFVHHKAALDGSGLPPNSLAAVRACLAAGAEWIEVDICALAEDDFLLVHSHDLQVETSGRGEVSTLTPADVCDLRLLQDGRASAQPPALLSEVVGLLAEAGGAARLQLDWKDHAPYPSREPLERLARLLAPLGRRALVSSMADWQLSRLAKAAPEIELGYDIHLYIEHDPPGSTPETGALPRSVGAYGYRDDHPLASTRWGTSAAYLAERCKGLLALAPSATTFYCNHRFLMRCLADGFDWVQALHAAGKVADAWTLDADDSAVLADARMLAERGCDLLTSNTPLALAALLKEDKR